MSGEAPALDGYVEHRNPAPGTDGIIAIGIDRSLGAIRLTGSGFWSVGQIDAYFVDLRRLIARLRADTGRVLVLADMRGVPPQSPEVAERLYGQNEELYREGDRSAIILDTSLAKMQMRRLLDERYHGFFLSVDAAETWLRAYS